MVAAANRSGILMTPSVGGQVNGDSHGYDENNEPQYPSYGIEYHPGDGEKGDKSPS
jgi:hypothetical protein